MNTKKKRKKKLTWTLINNPDAWAMLAALTRRRDEFVKDEGDRS